MGYLQKKKTPCKSLTANDIFKIKDNYKLSILEPIIQKQGSGLD